MRGRWRKIVNRVVLFTNFPIAELPSPRIRYPSQWPGTARSAASAGRSLIMISEATKRRPFLVRFCGKCNLFRASGRSPPSMLSAAWFPSFPCYRWSNDFLTIIILYRTGKSGPNLLPQSIIHYQFCLLWPMRRPVGVPLGCGGAIVKTTTARCGIAA